MKHAKNGLSGGIFYLGLGLIGLLAGYYGGVLDSILMRICDIMMAFPFTILVITIMAILGKGTMNLFIALWLVGWMSYAKLVRSEVLVLKDSEFIQAARVAGFSDVRIGKRFELTVDRADDATLETARRIADEILSNSVIEDVVNIEVVE